MTASCQIASDLSERIYEFIQTHKSIPWRQSWVSKTFNPITDTRYKGINHFLTLMHMEDYSLKIPQFLTYRQIRSLGGYIKPWEKSVPIIFFKSYKKDVKEENDEWGTELVSHNAVTVMGHKPAPKSMIPKFFLRTYHNYGLEQTTLPLETYDADREKNQVQPDHESFLKTIQDYCDREHIDVTYAGLRCFYNSSLDSINITRRENFDKVEDWLFTLAHELAHSTWHKDRLSRFKSSSDMETSRKEQYAFEEVVADMTACLLLRQFNINPDVPNSASYISWWLTYWRDKKQQLYKACREAQKAVDYICNNALWWNTERLTT